MVITVFMYPTVDMNIDRLQEERRQNVFVVEREAKKALNLVTSGDSTPQRNCSPERDRTNTPNTPQFQSIEEEVKVDCQIHPLSYFPSYYRIHRVINVSLFNHLPFQRESQEIVSSIFHFLICTKPGIPTFPLVMILNNTIYHLVFILFENMSFILFENMHLPISL